MQILTAAQIREWDQFTIDQEPIASIDLMERAAEACLNWLRERKFFSRRFALFCGKGNNGGDGLALGRLLMKEGCQVSFFILEFGNIGTPDFQKNLQKLHEAEADIRFISTKESFPTLSNQEIIIDSLFGLGLNRKLEGLSADLVSFLNHQKAAIIAIDLPSGLFADGPSPDNSVIHARYTLSFQCFKLAFLYAENAKYTGDLHLLNIGLLPAFLKTIETQYEVLTDESIRKILKPRPAFSHKGTYGHALLMAGSYGKMGAAVLAARACLHTGSGLTTVYSPGCGYTILQLGIPEAMVIADIHEHYLTDFSGDLSQYQAIAIGPGIGTADTTGSMLENLLMQIKTPLVLDADALNLISKKQHLASRLRGAIITPHPKEFDRLFGEAANRAERLEKAQKMAKSLEAIIVLKGRFTAIAAPEGKLYINMTGNPGMATGGSGDVLTGMICSLLAQGYSGLDAARLAVFLHGRAGDLAADASSEESLSASHIIHFIGMAFRSLRSHSRKRFF